MNRTVLICLHVGLLLFMFFGMPDSIMYAQQGFGHWLPFILLVGVQGIIVYAIARSFSISPHRSKAVVALAILITVPSFGIYAGMRSDRELSKNGVVTSGVVYKKWESNGRSGHRWNLKCNFKANGKIYSTFTELDNKNLYHTGDTLHILYSKSIPTNCRIKELENN